MKKHFKIEYLISALAFALVCFMVGIFYGRNSVRYEHGAVVEVEKTLKDLHADAEDPEGLETPETTEISETSVKDTVEAEESERASGTPVNGENAGPTAPIDLNTATAAEVETLPGIGSVLAQRVVDYREEHGKFRSIREILQVEGIGDKKFEAIESLITVR